MSQPLCLGISGRSQKYGLTEFIIAQISGNGKTNIKTNSHSSESSRICRLQMEHILERLKANQHCSSTKANYLSIWRHFNSFLIRLDSKPKLWKDRVSLFCAHLANKGNKSATIRSYVSAIKNMLMVNKYKWNDSRILVNAILRACKIANNVVITRFPIHIGLLETLLFELDRLYGDSQPYLNFTFRALFLVAYYGMLRVGEVAKSQHSIEAKDVHIAHNKKKLMFILHSSKTHNRDQPPQFIKISQTEVKGRKKCCFCPFKAMKEYIGARGSYQDEKDNPFILSNGEPIKAE